MSNENPINAGRLGMMMVERVEGGVRYIVLPEMVALAAPHHRVNIHCMDAEERSKRLLYAHLTPAQQVSLEKEGYFEVVGNKTGTTYRISPRKHSSRNVVSLRKGKPSIAYDAQPMIMNGWAVATLPWGDVLLGQKLTLENDEDEFLNRACAMPCEIEEAQLEIERIMHMHQRRQRYQGWRTFFR